MIKQKEFETAFTSNNIKDVKKILKNSDLNPAMKNNYAICYSSEHGYIDIVKLLLKDKRVDPSGCYNSAIHKASANGHTDIVRLLLKDTRVNPSDPYNKDILQSPSGNGYFDIVQVLLKDPRVYPSNDNNWAIKLALKNKHLHIAKLLWKHNKFQNTLSKSDVDLYNKMITENISNKVEKF
jgi:hypothetical protein